MNTGQYIETQKQIIKTGQLRYVTDFRLDLAITLFLKNIQRIVVHNYYWKAKKILIWTASHCNNLFRPLFLIFRRNVCIYKMIYYKIKLANIGLQGIDFSDVLFVKRLYEHYPTLLGNAASMLVITCRTIRTCVPNCSILVMIIKKLFSGYYASRS